MPWPLVHKWDQEPWSFHSGPLILSSLLSFERDPDGDSCLIFCPGIPTQSPHRWSLISQTAYRRACFPLVDLTLRSFVPLDVTVTSKPVSSFFKPFPSLPSPSYFIRCSKTKDNEKVYRNPWRTTLLLRDGSPDLGNVMSVPPTVPLGWSLLNCPQTLLPSSFALGVTCLFSVVFHST